MLEEAANNDETKIDHGLRHMIVCMTGPDRPGLLAKVASLAPRNHVDLRHCSGDACWGFAVIFLACQGNDRQLDDMAEALERTFPEEKDEECAPDAMVGYAVNVKNVGEDSVSPPTYAAVHAKDPLTLRVIAVNAMGVLSTITAFLKRENIDLAHYRGTFDRVSHCYHEFGILPPRHGYDRQSLERHLYALKESEQYDRCELVDGMGLAR